MHSLMRRGVAVIVTMALGACSVAEEGPTCSSEAAQSVLTQVLWDSIEQQFSASAGAQNAKPFMDAARAKMQIQVSGITTTEASKDIRQVRCQATLSSQLPEVPNADFALLRTAIANEPGNVRLDDRTLTGSVEYRVQLSDDGTTTRVEARGFRAFTDVVGGVTSALYISEAQEKALAAEKAAKGNQSSPATAASSAPESHEPDPLALAFEGYETADKLLNEAYQAARASMADPERTALRDQQREWIKQRDAECSEESIVASYKDGAPGGSAITLEIVGCKTTMTKDRTKQLRTLKG